MSDPKETFDHAHIVSQGHPHYVAMMAAANRQDYLNHNAVFSYGGPGTLYTLRGDVFPGCTFHLLTTAYHKVKISTEEANYLIDYLDRIGVYAGDHQEHIVEDLLKKLRRRVG